MWKHPKNPEQELPVKIQSGSRKGRTHPQLLKLLKEGHSNILTEGDYVYNKETHRVVSKKSLLDKDGALKKKFADKDLHHEGGVVYKKEKIDLSKILKNPDYYKDAVPYDGKFKQRFINRNGESITEKIKEMIDAGRVPVDVRKDDIGALEVQLDNFKQPHICYLTVDGKYRCGGFLLKTQGEEKKSPIYHADGKPYIVLIVPDKRLKFPVQLHNIKTLYVKERKGEEITELVPTQQPQTRFPVQVGGVIVYYAKDNYKKRRFMETQRYKKMVEFAKSNGMRNDL